MTYQLNNLNVASLDFDDIKTSLVNFLKQQTDLQDIDWENNASAANMLLNILCSVTAYNGVYAQFGYVNSFATTTTLLQSLLGIAANNSVLIAPVQSASTTFTVTSIGTALEDYSTFSAQTTTGANTFFFNIEAIDADTSASIKLYSGTEVVSFTNYDYATQSCELPYTVDPRTINFYQSTIGSGDVTKWTRVDKNSTAVTGNQTTFTVINGPQGYIVTNNFPSSTILTTASTVLVKAVLANGVAGNNAALASRSDATLVVGTTPTGGYDLITVSDARSRLLFQATGQERCVTLNDYENAILSSGISGTDDIDLISVQNHCCLPATVKVYVTGLSVTSAALLMSYLGERITAGINIIYEA